MSGIDHIYSSITSADNLFASWAEFWAAKRSKTDVTAFERHVEDNLFDLRADLTGWTYQHGPYKPFTITDPKPRSIHKASVRDRIVHHAIYRILYPIFNSRFIDDSFSCRFDKGTHRAVRRLESFTRKVSHNYSRPCWALKCDIRKFFDSVDHEILMRQLEERIECVETLWLLKGILDSYQSKPPTFDLAGRQIERERERERESTFVRRAKGLPIGNLTSQLFANIYMNEFDQWVKHELKQRYYLRYTDDFVFLSSSREELEALIPQIARFLAERLRLSLHPHKVSIRKLNQGIDFLGYVVRPHSTVLRTRTKKRMLRRIEQKNLSSYMGLLEHCDGYLLQERIQQLVPPEEYGSPL